MIEAAIRQLLASTDAGQSVSGRVYAEIGAGRPVELPCMVYAVSHTEPAGRALSADTVTRRSTVLVGILASSLSQALSLRESLLAEISRSSISVGDVQIVGILVDRQSAAQWVPEYDAYEAAAGLTVIWR